MNRNYFDPHAQTEAQKAITKERRLNEELAEIAAAVTDAAESTDLRFVEHPLYSVFLGVLQQVMDGKGKRHGGATTDFMDQPWRHYAKMHGPGFLTGQAAKKLEEAASTMGGEAYVQELRGAIAYIGMALVFFEDENYPF